MNTIYKYLLFSVQLLFFAKYCHAQNGYKIKIKEAEILYENKSYLDAARTYSEAFISNNNLGLVCDRYEAARCWALEKRLILNKPLVYLLDTINFDDQEPRKQTSDLMRLYGANSPTINRNWC